jgi:hypothetical protein
MTRRSGVSAERQRGAVAVRERREREEREGEGERERESGKRRREWRVAMIVMTRAAAEENGSDDASAV